MRRAWAVVLILVVAGCDAPTRPEHDPRFTRIDGQGAVQPDGRITMTATVGFPSLDGGEVRLGAPTLGTISAVTIDGSPRSASGETVDLDVQNTQATIAWTVNGAVERYPDGVVVTLPVWTPPATADADDKRVPIATTLALPAPPTGEIHWHGASPANARLDGTTVVLDGELGTTTESTLTFLLSADALPSVPVLPGVSRVSSFESRQAPLDAADQRIAADLEDDRRREDLIANIYWGAVGLEVAIPFLVTLLALSRAAAVRRRATKDVPEELSEQPSMLPPAVVALLHAEGKDIGEDAAAATILDLAQRRVITIEGTSGQRYTIKVAKDSERPGEAELVALLREKSEATGPPSPIPRSGAWWTALRHEVVAIARQEGLLRRRFPSALFLTAVVALAITTIPLYARSPETLVAGIVVATILSALPFVGGFVLTGDGHRERAKWIAYRRHLAGADLEDVDPAGVIIWEKALVYAAALGVATTAIGDLS